jgi:MFS family permease
MNNKNRLFYGSCFALITTAFSFSIRAGILPQLGEAFDLSGQQLGFINSMWFLGFPISMILGGLFYHTIGPKRIMQFAFLHPHAGDHPYHLLGRLCGIINLYTTYWDWKWMYRSRL